ncbi:VTT domain-containing protein [Rhodobacteraceae bacterium HSP-20]|uniref:TVP38/TMEM64 family membrane protein n=1 Tax=Paragemmobacter amnigenus TaxID=2852097 RepID=A0ABS6J053_9RHOB|nr:VTT domain-containing protein [Rhodobacter amnigenus]MBU9697118.1 VTT domain-containing protein [Rhodobacter amnigenus]MBV4388345.1 VTT domain-containing protein [Rhodobacter amnigenus]
MTQPAPHPERNARWRMIPALVLLAVAVAGAVLLRDELGFDALAAHRETLLAYRDAHYALAVVVFVAAYTGIVAFSLPGATVATLTGGFLFGLFPGVLFNLAGATVGAVLLFLAVKAGFGARLAARIEAEGGKVARLREALARNEWEVLFLMRVTPVVPFFMANLIPALLNISLVKFAVTTAVGIVPGALVLTSVGSGLGEVFETGGRPDLSVFLEPWVAGPIVGLVALGVMPIVVRALRRGGL